MEDHEFSNHLVNESSPYLLQHAHNPVDWYPWGPEALAKAKKENKLLLISIGYAACHWCHVMEHESFEDEAVANYMNEHYVCIKIDREERPDIDQVYMNAVQLLTGRGGWPLNCIALPDGRPIYGGTYYPKDQWMDVLAAVQTFVKENPDKAEEQAKALTEGVRGSDIIKINESPTAFEAADLDNYFKAWKMQFDLKEGGTGTAPKFPLPIAYNYLLHHSYFTDNKTAQKVLDLTLHKMADGGIYDQVGGGFARYSTDKYWKVPHFEKMLYDNSQLISLYAKAYQATKYEYYKTIVDESIAFVERELSHPKAGFYSSLDADSEGEEGKFYVWTQKELENILGNDAPLFIEYFRVQERGNWEHGNNILLKSQRDKSFVKEQGLTVEAFQKKLVQAKEKLLKARSKRVRPGLDDKIISAWNALMITAYVDAYRATGNDSYLNKAEENAIFLKKDLMEKDHRLNRNFKNGKASINAFLDDYAFTIEAFTALYQASFEEAWLLEAKALTEYVQQHFLDAKSGMFFYTSDLDPKLIARKMEIADNVIPSSNSQMAKNLYILGHYFSNSEYTTQAERMLMHVKKQAETGGAYYANWNILMSWLAHPPYEVAILGEDCIAQREALDQKFMPNVFYSGGKTEASLPLLKNKLMDGKTTIYVCQDKSCKLPTTRVDEALKLIKK